MMAMMTMKCDAYGDDSEGIRIGCDGRDDDVEDLRRTMDAAIVFNVTNPPGYLSSSISTTRWCASVVE